MARYQPGELDQLVSVQRKQSTPDGMGGTGPVVWAEQFQLWAHVRAMSGREVTDYERVNAEARYVMAVRWPVDIREEDAIVWEGDFYNIRALKKPKGRDLYCEIEAQRGVAQ